MTIYFIYKVGIHLKYKKKCMNTRRKAIQSRNTS